MKPANGKDDRRMKRAQLIRDGMSWRQACLQSGYSLSVANRGPRGYLENKPDVVKDFERAAEEASYKPDFIKKAVTHRLVTSVVNGTPSKVAREAELLGKMKEVDMFVRPNTELQEGIFAALAEPAVNAEVIDAYVEPEDE